MFNSQPQASIATQTYAIRKLLQNQVLESQRAEHAFYEDVAVKVETAARLLTEGFSSLLQVDLLNWSETYLSDFSNRSNIPIDDLRQWKATFERLEVFAESETLARDISAKAKAEQSQYSGVLWGAKAGFESQFAEATKTLAVAEGSESELAAKANSEQEAAEALGEKLLRQCLANATAIAQSLEYGGEIRTILTIVGEEAATALAGHNNEQKTQIHQMRKHLDGLSAIYENK